MHINPGMHIGFRRFIFKKTIICPFLAQKTTSIFSRGKGQVHSLIFRRNLYWELTIYWVTFKSISFCELKPTTQNDSSNPESSIEYIFLDSKCFQYFKGRFSSLVRLFNILSQSSYKYFSPNISLPNIYLCSQLIFLNKGIHFCIFSCNEKFPTINLEGFYPT